MAQILETNTELEVVAGNFTLVTEYSGETNPNVTFSVTFNVTDGLNVIVGVEIEINGDLYYTDSNGQVILDLIRDDYTANLSKIGYENEVVNFTILDQNITENIVMVQIGSFDDSFDDSFEK